MIIKAAVNGGRNKEDHPATPVTAEEIAADARRMLFAGSDVVHAHARTPDSYQTIAGEHVGAMIRAVRQAAPGIVIGTTTGLWTCSGHRERMSLIRTWPRDAQPDFASVAFCEEGAAETAALVLDQGMELESAVWAMEDIPALLASETLHRNIRILIEPQETDPQQAVRSARAMAAAIREAGVTCPLLYHGDGATVWAVLDAAIEDGCETRIGLEDGKNLPDGSLARDNVELLLAARVRMAARQPG
ncbi:3-keto-5-aminohexanoate cleavage protein (plasmid) [Arthrobacter sp. KN11-1C]|uniref:3-keto-5-aminohexanoate cleavage protein n=1 Tax=Arthrobacter sp. KN11-1C TaxID=3445774 RepID=UPI003F9F8EEF